MNIPIFYLLKKMWRYADYNRRNMVLYIVMSVTANIIGALEPLIFGLFLNQVQSHGVNESNYWSLMGMLMLLIVLELVFWSLHGPSRVMETTNAFIVRANYKNFLLKGTMDLPMEWHADHHSGDTIDKIEKGTGALHNFSSRLFSTIQTLVMVLTSFGILAYFNLLSGTISIVISFLTFYVLILFDRKLVPGYRKVNRMENTASAKVFDYLSNITTVVILRVEQVVLKVINSAIYKPYKQYNTNSKVNEVKWFFTSVIGRIAVVLIVGFYLFAQLKNGHPILAGTVFILYGYAEGIRNSFYRFADDYNDILKYRASVSNAEELSKDFLITSDASQDFLPQGWSDIAIKNLSFSYHTKSGANLHIDNISMQIKKGERIALIGESGGGKTTFLKLFRDLYKPKKINLKVEGKSLKLGFVSISDSISLIPQDPEIFATTIRENITLGVEYPDDYILQFVEMASFSEVLKRIPKGLDSSIVEKGVNLSGGEKQRLALARGLLASQDKDIVLLDEPTSSVDFNNELQIFENIFKEFPDKTFISSVHRLHLLSLFDSVYFFKDGKIIASGSFEDLKKTSLDFQILWDKYIKTRDANTK